MKKRVYTMFVYNLYIQRSSRIICEKACLYIVCIQLVYKTLVHVYISGHGLSVKKRFYMMFVYNLYIQRLSRIICEKACLYIVCIQLVYIYTTLVHVYISVHGLSVKKLVYTMFVYNLSIQRLYIFQVTDSSCHLWLVKF